MEVDEELPGPSRTPELLTTDADASGVASPQTSSHEEPASADAALGNEDSDATCSEGRAWTEDAWHTVLSRRKKKNQLKKQHSQTEKAMNTNQQSNSDPLAEKEKKSSQAGFPTDETTRPASSAKRGYQDNSEAA
ncbi:hypothetical protein HPB52_004161 [Rhipicephalus sanguineus]|uniref:Uncharacterized protein n=1 Tax=Rhipicephalus sanguineus TaxID=34632 RepID=A0A9D4PV86_RHISA|nr:hypothetical protein HPB52_004161 [Rhipicephalus sanguineus]